MPANSAPTYKDFWEVRSRQAFWPTQHVAFRVGAFLALMAERFSISPNTITVSSFIVSAAGASAVFWIESPLPCALVMLVLLQLGYYLDCADGSLARVTGKVSSFGALADKAADSASLVFVLGFPCIASLADLSGTRIPVVYLPYIVLVAVATRFMLSVMVWLKAAMPIKTSRLTEDDRPRKFLWKLKRAVGVFTDEALYRFILALSWGFQIFWETLAVYAVFQTGVVLLYAVATKRELDALDRNGKEGVS